MNLKILVSCHDPLHTYEHRNKKHFLQDEAFWTFSSFSTPRVSNNGENTTAVPGVYKKKLRVTQVYQNWMKTSSK